MIGANVTTNNGATSSIASPSSSVSTTPNIRSNLHVPSTQMTNTSSTHNNSPKSNCPNNLDVALQAFIQRFVPSDNTTIGQILQGISRNAESVQISNTSQTTPHTISGPSAVSSMTVVHKLDQFTEKLVNENMKLREENEVLKAQIAALTGSQTTVTVERTSTDSTSTACSSPLNSTSTTHCASPVTDPSSTKALTMEEINQFNKLPKDLKEFYEQMLSGKFSCEVYSKCSSTKSVFTKRKLVFRYIQEYPAGIEKFYDDYRGKSPSWVYNNLVRSRRS